MKRPISAFVSRTALLSQQSMFLPEVTDAFFGCQAQTVTPFFPYTFSLASLLLHGDYGSSSLSVVVPSTAVSTPFDWFTTIFNFTGEIPPPQCSRKFWLSQISPQNDLDGNTSYFRRIANTWAVLTEIQFLLISGATHSFLFLFHHTWDPECTRPSPAASASGSLGLTAIVLGSGNTLPTNITSCWNLQCKTHLCQCPGIPRSFSSRSPMSASPPRLGTFPVPPRCRSVPRTLPLDPLSPLRAVFYV